MEFDEILPNLLIGSCPRTPAHVDELAACGVTAVLNVQTNYDFAYCQIDWPAMQTRYDETEIEVRRIPVEDFNVQALRRELPACVSTLQELLEDGHRVMVHCSAGKNRAPSTVITYLHWIEKRPLDEAILHVWECRRCEPYIDAIRLATRDRAEGLGG